jgi:N-acetylmuramoyl-L-alanine amidase
MIHAWPISYEARLEARDAADIDLVVIHCTELPDLARAREFAERIQHPGSQTGNCGHLYVDRDGTPHRFVADTRVAHHCHAWNAHSIGIELVNLGRFPDWRDSRHQAFTEPYPAAQIDGLIALLDALRAACPNLARIAGHEDLDRRMEPASDDPSIALPRRRDPGPLFPWAEVIAACALERLVPPVG